MFRHYCLWSEDKKIKTPSQNKTVVAIEKKPIGSGLKKMKQKLFIFYFLCFLDWIWLPLKPGFTQGPECQLAMKNALPKCTHPLLNYMHPTQMTLLKIIDE